MTVKVDFYFRYSNDSVDLSFHPCACFAQENKDRFYFEPHQFF